MNYHVQDSSQKFAVVRADCFQKHTEYITHVAKNVFILKEFANAVSTRSQDHTGCSIGFRHDDTVSKAPQHEVPALSPPMLQVSAYRLY